MYARGCNRVYAGRNMDTNRENGKTGADEKAGHDGRCTHGDRKEAAAAATQRLNQHEIACTVAGAGADSGARALLGEGTIRFNFAPSPRA